MKESFISAVKGYINVLTKCRGARPLGRSAHLLMSTPRSFMLETRIMSISMTAFHMDGLPITTLYVIPIHK